jgi:hypothetical protein
MGENVTARGAADDPLWISPGTLNGWRPSTLKPIDLELSAPRGQGGTMKKRHVKLTLTRETIRRLQDEVLSRAEGAAKPTSDCPPDRSALTLCASCLCPPK